MLICRFARLADANLGQGSTGLFQELLDLFTNERIAAVDVNTLRRWSFGHRDLARAMFEVGTAPIKGRNQNVVGGGESDPAGAVNTGEGEVLQHRCGGEAEAMNLGRGRHHGEATPQPGDHLIYSYRMRGQGNVWFTIEQITL